VLEFVEGGFQFLAFAGTGEDAVKPCPHSNALVIVEAKYHSGKSSTVPTADLQSSEQPSDQLVREWDACRPDVAAEARYESDLQEAMNSSHHVLIYLTDAKRNRASRRAHRVYRAARGHRKDPDSPRALAHPHPQPAGRGTRCRIPCNGSPCRLVS